MTRNEFMAAKLYQASLNRKDANLCHWWNWIERRVNVHHKKRFEAEWAEYEKATTEVTSDVA